jgi:hypothetical protein
VKLKSIFTSVPLEQFKPSTQAALQQLLDAINADMRANPDCLDDNDDYESFKDLILRNSIDTLTWFFDNALQRTGQGIRDDLRGLDILTAWVMEGAPLTTGMVLFGHKDDPTAMQVLNEGCHFGAHNLLFRIGYKDSHLTLKALSFLLEKLHQQVENNTDYYSPSGTSLDWLTLKPFGKPFVGVSSSSTTAVHNYLDYFYPEQFNHYDNPPDVTLKHLVNNAFADAKNASRPMNLMLNTVLNQLVLNTGLRFKGEGMQAPIIIERLTPVLEEIIQSQFGADYTISVEELAGFRRQVWVNLFSPFAEDLALLDVHPNELMGHPKNNPTDHWPHKTKSTMSGPIEFSRGDADYSATAAMARGLENMGHTLDLDVIMTGVLAESNDICSLIRLWGGCTTIDHLLERFATEGPTAIVRQHNLQSTLTALDFERLPALAKLGFVAARIEYGYESATLRKDKLFREDGYCPLKSISGDPELKTEVLAYMAKFERVTAELMVWCGFDGEALNALGELATDDIKSSLLENDLGL